MPNSFWRNQAVEIKNKSKDEKSFSVKCQGGNQAVYRSPSSAGLPHTWEIQNTPWCVIKSSSSVVPPSCLHLFWSGLTPETIRDCIIIAAGLSFHIHPPQKGLITILSILLLTKTSENVSLCFPQNIDYSVARERQWGATNENWESETSLSLIALISFDVGMSFLFLYFIYLVLISSLLSLFFFQSCHSEPQPYLKSPEPANVDWKGWAISASWSHQVAKPLVADLPINLNLANGTQGSHSWLAGGLRTHSHFQ